MQKVLNKISSSLFQPFQSIDHGFLGRNAEDNTELVQKLYPTATFIELKQIHSNQVVVLDESLISSKQSLKAGDALLTSKPNLVLAIKTADCLPLLGFVSNTGIICAIHAGWRGLFNGVIENTLRLAEQFYQTKPTQWHFAIGPAISAKAYEVDFEFVENFETNKPGYLSYDASLKKPKVNLKKTAHNILETQGIPTKQISILSNCTYNENTDWYSFRQGDTKKRNLSYITLNHKNMA